MTNSERKTEPIEVRWGKNRYKYSIVDQFYICEWRRGMDFSKTPWPLQGLSPIFVETVGRSSGTTNTVRKAMALIAASIIIFFSQYNQSIPLLAPFLFVLGSWWFAGALSEVLPRTWTEVRKLNGEVFFSILQPAEKSPEWLKFEEDLLQAIHETNTAVEE